jgi:hypothetical protein
MLSCYVITFIALAAYLMLIKFMYKTENMTSKTQFIMYAMQGCGHCDVFKNSGVWEQLQKQYENKYQFMMYTLNGPNPNDNLIIKARGISGFPTFEVRRGTQTVKFSGNRDFDTMSKFLAAN